MAFKMHCPKCGGLDFSIERDNRTFGAVAQAYELVFHCRCGKQLFGEVLLKEYEQQKKAFEAGGDAAALQGTPDARVERIEDRLRAGKKPLGSDGDRWRAQLTSDLDDDDDGGGDDEEESAEPAAHKRASAAKATAKGKEPPAKKKPIPAVASKSKAAAARPKKKAAVAKARPKPVAAKKKQGPVSRGRKEARRPSAGPPRMRAGSATRQKAAAKTAARSKHVHPAPKAKAGQGICIWPGCGKPTRANSKYCSRACSNKNARSRHKTRVRKGATRTAKRR
jgi:hypothetical protein